MDEKCRISYCSLNNLDSQQVVRDDEEIDDINYEDLNMELLEDPSEVQIRN
jgi:hypothetical protein